MGRRSGWENIGSGRVGASKTRSLVSFKVLRFAPKSRYKFLIKKKKKVKKRELKLQTRSDQKI